MALLPTHTPMGFVAILGIIALSGMIIRNSVILIDQIDMDLARGLHPWEAVIDATTHRLRPIALTAAAAILGMIPIASEIFWGPMAYAIIGGLLIATLLTLLFCPRSTSPGSASRSRAARKRRGGRNHGRPCARRPISPGPKRGSHRRPQREEVKMKAVGRCARFVIASLFCGLLILPALAKGGDVNPLRPLDASSPQATLQGFVAGMDGIYRGMTGIINDYAGSDRLYLTPAERRVQAEVFARARNLVKYLDVSQISPVVRNAVATERAIQLKEILDRIEVPPFAEIPDKDAMARSNAKVWTLPDTEIEIVAVPDNRGEMRYLFSAETVDRLPEFYERAKALPYKPGSGKELSDAYRRVTAGDISTIYEAYISSPAGLERIVPLRWFLKLPAWIRARLFGIAVWQWFGLVAGLASPRSSSLGARRLGRRLAARPEGEEPPRWPALLTPLAAILVAAFLIPALCLIFRIGGLPNIVVTLAQTAVLYLSAAWLAMVGGGVLANFIVCSEHLRRGSLDSQLIRLSMRLAGIARRHRAVDPGRLRAGLPLLFGAGRARRRRPRRRLGGSRQSGESAWLAADHAGEAVSRRPVSSASPETRAPSRMSAFAAPASAPWTIR